MFLPLVLIICVSCPISETDQDKYLMRIDKTIRVRAIHLSERFKHHKTRDKSRLGFIRNSWMKVFGPTQTKVKFFDPRDMLIEALIRSIDGTHLLAIA